MNNNLESLWFSASQSISQAQPKELNPELMARFTGGGNSAGNFCSVSAECNSDGHSCGSIKDMKFEDIVDYLQQCSGPSNSVDDYNRSLGR